jgi:hypothetical protein
VLFNNLGFLFLFLPVTYVVFWRLTGKTALTERSYGDSRGLVGAGAGDPPLHKEFHHNREVGHER